MKILFATAELAPLVRVGGLAEAASGLVRALRAANIDVELVLPDYHPEQTMLSAQTIEKLDVPAWVGGAEARRGIHPDVGPITLITAPDIARDGIYGDPETAIPYFDNDRRFFHFSAAIAAIANASRPDVIHLNDWHTSPVAAMFPVDRRPPIVLSIHNLAYQGWCDPGWLEILEPGARDPYLVNQSCVPLVGALALADRIIAVSPTYAEEILTPEHGAGVDWLLRERAAAGAVVGIRNGIDVADWNPRTDEHLSHHYDTTSLASKKTITDALRRELGLLPSTGPLFSMVTRLVDQKGVDLVIDMAPYLQAIDAQLVVLGSGDLTLAAALTDVTTTHPGCVAFVRGYDLALSHRITAGADLYLMPSRFEPCGLAQMQAMAYGNLPVVSDVGGLHDTVVDADADRAGGTGVRMVTNDLAGLVDAMHRGAALWRDPVRRRTAQSNGMLIDWSWTEPAKLYIEQYRAIARD
jgi:starch synthase